MTTFLLAVAAYLALGWLVNRGLNQATERMRGNGEGIATVIAWPGVVLLLLLMLLLAACSAR